MKHALIILVLALPLSAWATDSTNLAHIVDAHWTNRNYNAIIETVDKVLQDDPHDILALCIKYGYYSDIKEDFDEAKANAARLVTEVDSRLRNAKGAVYDLAKAVAAMEKPDIATPKQHEVDARIEYRHKEFQDRFPFMVLYVNFSENFDHYGEAIKASHAPPAGRGEAPRP